MNLSYENSTSFFFAFSKITHTSSCSLTLPSLLLDLKTFWLQFVRCRCLGDPLVTGSKILRGKHHQKRNKFYQEPLLDSPNLRWIVLAYRAYWVIVCGNAASFCNCHAVLNSRQCALPFQTNTALVYKALTHPLDVKRPKILQDYRFRQLFWSC